MDEAAILARFLDHYRADLEGPGVRSLSAYQALFPGFEELIAREYMDLGGPPPAKDDAAAGAVSLSPKWIGPFRIIEEIAHGGQGDVYLAEDPRLHRHVALKVLHGTGVFTENALVRFRREAEVTARLDHPGICPVYEAATAGGIAYIAMRFVPGRSLAAQISESRASNPNAKASPESADPRSAAMRRGDALASEGILPDREAISRILGLVRQVALALHAAHEKGVIHRDVKPGNIMVTPASEAVLVDFGFAHQDDSDQPLTLSGDLFGTPAYMSPEQLSRHATRIDRRTDVWSLGVTLYEALTLERPFESPTREALQRAILTETPNDPRRINPAIPKDLRVVIETALEKAPDRRYQTAGGFADDLGAVLEARPITARPVGPWTRLMQWGAREPAKAGLLSMALVALPTISVLIALRIQDLPRIEAQLLAEDHAKRDEHIALARVILREGDPDRAIQQFQSAIGFDATSFDAIMGIALTQWEEERHADALRTLQIHAGVLGERRAVVWLRNNLMEKLGRHGPPAPLPPLRDPLDYKIESDRLMIEGKGGRKEAYGEAKGAILNAILLSAAPHITFYGDGVVAAAHAGDRLTVEALDGSLRRFWPQSDLAHHWRGNAWDVLGEEDRAIEAFRESARCRPDSPRHHFNLGNLLLNKGLPDQAIPELREAIRLEPGDAQAHSVQYAHAYICLGRALSDTGLRNEAAEAWRQALALNPKDADSQYGLGKWLEEEGRLPEALVAFRHAINARRDFGAAYDMLGVALERSGDLAAAIEAWRTSTEVEPHGVRSHVNLSIALINRGHIGDLCEAIIKAKKAIDIDPGFAEAYVPLANAFRLKGQFRDGLNAIRRGHELGASRPQWPDPTAEYVSELEDLVRQEDRMLRVASGEEATKGLPDVLQLADLASLTRRWGLAAKWYAAAIEQAQDSPVSDGDLALRGARAVVQAAAGTGTDSREATIDVAQLRPRALEWLIRELGNRQDELPQPELRQSLAQWLSEPLLAPVRDEPGVSNLPADEARAWREFWDEVRAVMR